MSIAPADGREHAAWPRWKKILAYLILFALASGSIRVIDRDAVLSARYWDHQRDGNQAK